MTTLVRPPQLSGDPNDLDVRTNRYLHERQDSLDKTIAGLAPWDAKFVLEAADARLPNSYVLTAGTNITLTPGVGILTIAASGGGGSSNGYYLARRFGGQ